MMCSVKAFFKNGHSVGWDAREEVGSDQDVAKAFADSRLISSVGPGKAEIVEIRIKDMLGAPVRSVWRVPIVGPIPGSAGLPRKVELSK